MTRTPLDQALAYAAGGIPVFPCREREPGRKHPCTGRGFYDASTDAATVTAWWRQWPGALIGVPTGRASGFVVLDVDVKRESANGFRTLAALGFGSLPDTPSSRTASGGVHLFFAPPVPEIRNTEG
ncbi:MAG: bifunctional DNA primase/polymerase, partial [Candidatus Saccharimonadales bacterium]